MGAHLDIRGVSKRFRQSTVLDDLSLSVGQGEFLSLLGPSGCGKTTLLRILAGLLAPDAGRVTLAGQDLGRLPAHRRNVGVVFQNYALFPHLTVAGNVGFGLRARGVARAQIEARVSELLEMVRLAPLAGRAITQLSGGQQQRVAMARALAVNPALILLDEPLSALDRKLRETMQVELRALLRQLGMTAIFVTHDQEEALALSDRIAVMNAGRIEQLATPEDIYSRPATPFVLDFVGQSTLLHGVVVEAAEGFLTLHTAAGPVRAVGHFARGARVLAAVRPERIAPGPASDAAWTGITLPLQAQTFLGSRRLLHGRLPAGDRALVEVPPETEISGDALPIRWRVSDTLVYPVPEVA
ncbi:ABC transporter ATP-binding protein [Roseomonas sp. GC11]|uniref:ABC transporter ATP-binding protein n=1 Tax=Roseomonas sp. GC11 TaxID=2950546 RepID=UPI002109154E|nr:ABC transporter ATP-binding protein [Roseomonas sp. GC11]MCQ4162535.1 ABC transporter ATP-binding protein [Roseomonas sp. GC11]